MSIFIQGRNYTGEFQELLQAKVPHLGSRCHELWGFGDSGNTAPFYAWVNLINTKSEQATLKLPTSDPFARKNLAKQHASWRAIEWVREHAEELIFEDGSFMLSIPRRKEGHSGSLKSSISSTHSPSHRCSRKSGSGSLAATPNPTILPEDGDSDSDPEYESPSLDILTRSNGINPYPYQLKLASTAIRGNTIANIPTGKGTHHSPVYRALLTHWLQGKLLLPSWC